MKRLLAYSGVAHIGYMLIGLAAMSANGVAMVLFYLVAYVFGNMGAFLVVETVARSEQSDGIDAYRGLAQRSPLLALAMLLFLLSLGGIPFVAGFWAKLYVFLAGVEQGLLGLVFVGAVLTVVALYYYLLVARRMYIEAPAHNGAGERGSAACRSDRRLPRRRHWNRRLSRPVGRRRAAHRADAVLTLAPSHGTLAPSVWTLAPPRLVGPVAPYVVSTSTVSLIDVSGLLDA